MKWTLDGLSAVAGIVLSPMSAMAAIVNRPALRQVMGYGVVAAPDLRHWWQVRVSGAAHRYHRLSLVGVHLLLIVVANYTAFWLRFDGSVPAPETALFVRMLPLLLATVGLTFIPFRLYRGLWRYTGVWDLESIIGGVLAGSTLFFVAVRWIAREHEYPRSVFLIQPVLLIFLVGGLRLVWRLYPELRRAPRGRRVLIFGAGNAGEMIVREMKKDPTHGYEPIGFVDDDPAKVGNRIHGVPVLGGLSDLSRIVGELAPQEVLLAIPRADPARVRSIVTRLVPYRVPLTTLPRFRDIVNGKVAVGHIRSLSIDDLLTRVPVALDLERVRHLIAGKRIVVTGAGGSIGSVLCRQIAALRPSSLVLYERYENGLYAITNDLADRGLTGFVHSVIGDVTDRKRLNAVLERHRPDIIFHAAAHKHVPLMELNPCEAVKNNVTGTRVVAEAAERHGVERFILISTDKAVNPSSVMGATKRVAELIQQIMARRGRTGFVTVRFGNVLGSNGSVVLRFLDQIKAGGPVTVTHPEMRRYFMLIDEAVQLVLYAAALGRRGAIYVLEMGEQIRLVDIARNLIRLSGFAPDEEIPISFIGPRPGEKLSEALVGADEEVQPASAGIMLVKFRASPVATGSIEREIAKLERLAARGDSAAVIRQLARIVPTFTADEAAAAEYRRQAAVDERRDQAAESCRRATDDAPRQVPEPAAARRPNGAAAIPIRWAGE